MKIVKYSLLLWHHICHNGGICKRTVAKVNKSYTLTTKQGEHIAPLSLCNYEFCIKIILIFAYLNSCFIFFSITTFTHKHENYWFWILNPLKFIYRCIFKQVLLTPSPFFWFQRWLFCWTNSHSDKGSQGKTYARGNLSFLK